MIRSPPSGYFYGNEADQYTFYRLPKALFSNERYKYLSDGAKYRLIPFSGSIIHSPRSAGARAIRIPHHLYSVSKQRALCPKHPCQRQAPETPFLWPRPKAVSRLTSCKKPCLLIATKGWSNLTNLFNREWEKPGVNPASPDPLGACA